MGRFHRILHVARPRAVRRAARGAAAPPRRPPGRDRTTVAGAACRLVVAVAAALALLGVARAETTLNVYTSIEADQLEKYARRFNQAHPDVRISWTRESTGVVTSRLLAEKDDPQADVVWGLAATSLLLMKGQGMLQPYAPKGLGRLDWKFRDEAEPPYWVGMDAWVAALCVNRVELETRKVPMPTSWVDLARPPYKGLVAMPNPVSSGTGFMSVSGWLQMFGEEGGWAYMDALHQNISHYTHSGSKPCVQAGRGEVPIGVSFAFRAARVRAAGAPIEIVIPSEGIGWDMEAAAIVRGTKKLEAAKTLLDWAISDEANKMYNEGYAVIGVHKLARPVAHFPPDIQKAMIENDFEWAASNRERILAEWMRRYDSKTEPEG